MTWLLHILGIDNLSGRWYGFWSGAGGDIGQITLIAAVLGAFRKHNCHQRRCWRIGRHLVDGTPWCDRHHQDARGGERGG
jgi:hypothetical protein